MIINRPENELLLCCATTFGGPEKVSRIGKLTQGGINWSHLIGMARRNGVMPLLYWNLKTIHFERVPEGIVKELCNEFRINMVRNLFLTAKLFNLLNLFKSNDIAAIPYKGPTLSVLTYGDIWLRHFVDLDFIVREDEVIRAKDLLMSEGYTPEYALPRDQEVAYLQSECEYNFFHDKTGLLVELHWAIVQKYFSCHFDVSQLWDDLRPVYLLGKQVMTISPEPLLLILCLHHGGKHQWDSLGWICDLAQLVVGHKDLDWERIGDLAIRTGIERILFLGLYLAKDMLGGDVPDEMDRRIKKDPAIPSLAEEVWKRIFTATEDLPGEAERFFFYLRMRENLRDKAAYCLRRLFTSTQSDWSLLRLPAALFPFYRFLRPFRLVRKFGRQALRLG
ncbi:MAG: nucleotidyltransferase domain-containing protein [Thermodesulfobacteriota bacterium]